MGGLRLLGGLLLTVTSCLGAQANQQLLGTWRLVSLTAEVAGTGEQVATFGDAPEGYLNYGPDGRMLVIIAKADRPRPDDTAQLTDGERLDLFNTMVAYGGTYRVDGEVVVHDVDISWNETWTGTRQVRRFHVEGDRLVIRQDPQSGPDGRRTSAVLVWRRVR